jgi:hypothetical protein
MNGLRTEPGTTPPSPSNAGLKVAETSRPGSIFNEIQLTVTSSS